MTEHDPFVVAAKLRGKGYIVHKGTITSAMPKKEIPLVDAEYITFLCNEWDYWYVPDEEQDI